MNLERTYRFECPGCGETLSAIGQPGPPEVIESQKRSVIWLHLMTKCPERCPRCDGTGRITVVYRCFGGENEEARCYECLGVGVIRRRAVPENVILSDN